MLTYIDHIPFKNKQYTYFSSRLLRAIDKKYKIRWWWTKNIQKMYYLQLIKNKHKRSCK